MTEKDRIEKILRAYLPEETGHQKTVLAAMNDAFLAGGKRVRPRLMEAVYRMLGGAGREIEPMMAAIEMIHTSSLIHDDLPAMDNDRLRRGRPTTWVTFGEDMAILAGDALMIYAFETACKALSLGADPARVSAAVRELAGRTGIYGMIGGQTADVELTGKRLTEDQMDFIYRKKTGALLEASMVIGAVMAGAPEEICEKVRSVASDVGMAFQIRDDILDLTGDEKALGKPVHSDEKNEKSTYAVLHGTGEAQRAVAAYSARALETLRSLPGESPELEGLIASLVTRDR